MATTALERKLLVAGEWIETGGWIEVKSPYSGESVARVAKAGADETRRAVDAAETALADPLPGHKRAEILVKVAGDLGRRHDEVARQISDEAGKPMKAARVEARRAMSTYTFAAVEARKLAGDVVPMDASQAGEGKLALTLRKPIGVVGAISPFNFPLNLVAHKLAPALAAGCPVVLKPAGQTPLSALLLAELETEAGLPPGWLNVLVGPASEIGDVLIEDERVRAITFTGSGTVGWKLAERAPQKKVNLELGNSTPAIVAADADIEAAAQAMAANAFSFAGQSCISVQRVYVERSAYDEFVRQLVPLVEGLKVGDPGDESTEMGPLISEDQRETVSSFVNGDAPVAVRGSVPDGDGFWFPPTVLCPVSNDDRAAREEIFGPIAAVIPFEDEADAVRIANDTVYGLSGSIWTQNGARALRVARALETGTISINSNTSVRVSTPFGGFKQSGVGRELGPHALEHYTELKNVYMSTA